MLYAASFRSTSFPMQGLNISDLQPDEILQQIANFSGVSEENIFVPDGAIANVLLSDDFSLNTVTISLMWEAGRNALSCQFRISQPSSDSFFLTARQRQERWPPFQYRLEELLNALKYLPQEHIRSLFELPPDKFSINFISPALLSQSDPPLVFYNRDGLTDDVGEHYLFFVIMPMYQHEDDPHRFSGDALSAIALYFALT